MIRILPVLATALFLLPAGAAAAERVPEGKESIVIDGMSEARKAAGKKVVKGPVPLEHQAHVDRGVACVDCHHKDEAGAEPEPCSSCHGDKTDGAVPKLSDAFHGGDSLPALQSCIGCHARKVASTKATDAPVRRDPCGACHSLLKK